MRDQAAEHFERHTGSHWRPRTGSMVNHRAPDRGDDRQPRLPRRQAPSRDRGAAARRAQDRLHRRSRLQRSPPDLGHARQVRAKHPDMVLLHGGSPKGAERIAARWADHRKVPQIAFKPDWTSHAKAAPFKRNDADAGGAADRRASFPRAPASRTTSPTRRGGSAFRSGSSAAAAHERRRSSKLLRRYCFASTDRVS